MPSSDLSPEPPRTYGLGQLAREAGLTIATVKYYLREGLLPEGRRRSATRADYDDSHVARLRLLRILREVGDVPVGRLRDLVAVLDDRDEGPTSTSEVLGVGAAALAGPPSEPGPREAEAVVLAGELVEQAGWSEIHDESPHLAQLRAVLEAVLTWEADGPGGGVNDLTTYLEAADAVARHDVSTLDATDPPALLAQLVVGQVVYGRLLGVLRLLAEEHHAALRYGGE